MKKIFLSIIVFFSIAVVVGFNFVIKNFSGVGPVITNAPQNIIDLIPSSDQEEPSNPVNNTNFPLKLPQGMTLSVYAKNLSAPRVLAKDPAGSLVASVTSAGKVVAVTPESTITVVEGLNSPHGLAFNCTDTFCHLYVAETDKVSIFDYERLTKKATNKRKIIDLPSGGGHFTRTLLIRDKLLYTSIGSSCNVCNEADNRRAAIFVSDLNGSNFTAYATGLRNSVFMTINPNTQDIWATEMGRDLLGDDTPAEEVNIIKEGKNYGWPVCYEDNIHDTNFDKNTYIMDPCSTKTPPQVKMQAHSAPLGLAFVHGAGWPKDWQNSLLVAFHGSWNRTTPTGYKIVKINLDSNGNYKSSEDFISGWLDGKTALGRPVDILLNQDGTGYITDDKAGVIYKMEIGR